MDQSVLVSDGLTLLRLLAREKIAMKASVLTYTDDRGWRLVLAPEKFDGTRAFYGRLAEILEPYDRLQQITLSDIDIIEPNSDAARELPQLKLISKRSYENVRLGGYFYRQIIELPTDLLN